MSVDFEIVDEPLSVIKSSESDKSFPLHSNPIERIVDYMIKGGGFRHNKREYTDPVTGIKSSIRLDDETR